MASENPNPFGFGCTPSNPFSFSNINSKETLTDSDIAESSRLRERHEKMDEIERIRRDLGSMWPVISAYTELSSKDDEANNVVAAAKKAVDAAKKATAAAEKAAAAADEAANKVAAYAAATITSPWLEQLKPGTKGPLDYLTQLYGAYEDRKALEHYKETNDEEYVFVEKEKFEYYKETNVCPLSVGRPCTPPTPRVYQNLEEEIEERRRLDHLAAMWPVISANTKSFCIDDDAGNGIAVQIAEANKAFAAAIKAVVAANEAANKVAAYAAASTAATAPRFQYFAVQIAEANKAFAAAIKPVAAANEAANKVAAYAAAAAARMEKPKPETKAPLDSPIPFGSCVSGFCGSVNEYPAIIELENKISSEPSCVNEYPADIELENEIFSEKARKALEHYKETNDEEYEFVEIENFETTILAPFIAYHITFKAKPKEKADSFPKLFFAEIYEEWHVSDDFEVKMCMILDSCGPDVKMGCDNFQGKDMLHPSGVEFWTGPSVLRNKWTASN